MKIELWYSEKINPQIREPWEKYFADVPNVKIMNGDICKAEVDAIVSPANSFGFMTGGLDLYLSIRFGPQVSRRIQRILKEEFERELFIGEAITVPTNDATCPNIICAPTMIVPMDISKTINVFLSTRGAILEANGQDFQSIAIPAMGLGVGRVPPLVCAKQMRAAYNATEEVWDFPTALKEASEFYYKLFEV